MIDLSTAKSPAVFISGGIDSMLVLAMVRETVPDIPIYCFNQNFTHEQQNILANLIKLWDLEVRSFPPSNAYIIPNGKNLAQVSEYNLNGVVIPVLRDFIDGPKCSLTLDKTRLESYPFEHDVVLLGTRKEDTSFATGQPFHSPEITLGGIKFICPIFTWTRKEVTAEAKKRELPYSAEFYTAGDETFDTGNLAGYCTKCLQGEGKVHCPVANEKIDSFQWDKEVALNNFRSKFGFSGLEVGREL